MVKHGINRKRLIKTFTDLVSIPSPSWNEHKVIDYIFDRLNSSGTACRKIRCGRSFNLYARVKGSRPGTPFLLSAHTDTVQPCDGIKPVVSKSRISSEGERILGSDNKAAIAMFIEAVQVIRETGIHHPGFEILLTCAEEVGLMGIQKFDIGILNSEYAFVFDSDGDIGGIITAAPFHFRLKITVTGRAAHAGMEPEKGVNAINCLAEILCAIPPSGRLDDETTLNAGTIQGGTATNIVAPSAECSLEVRSISRKRAESVIREIKKTARNKAASMGASVRIETGLEYPGYRISEKDRIVSKVKRAMGRIGITPVIGFSGGGSDTNILNRAGIKAVNLSCGMRNMHSTSEYILIKDLVNGACLVVSLAEYE